MKIIGVIPARYQSSRFPGKPLADICGKPMIWWVYQQAKKVKDLAEVYVATESEKVQDLCRQLNIPVVMTSDKHPTGTDRTCEVAQRIAADMYMVIMGDEPLILAEHIQTLAEEMQRLPKQYVAGMLRKKIENPIDAVNPTIIKLAVNAAGDLIFISRNPIPYPKESLSYEYFKNIGVYAFSKEALALYQNTPMGYLEKVEGLEMLRLLENHQWVKTVEVKSDSFSVDTFKDLMRVRDIMKGRNGNR